MIPDYSAPTFKPAPIARECDDCGAPLSSYGTPHHPTCEALGPRSCENGERVEWSDE